MVWDLPLQGDPGGPASISGTAPLVEFDLLHRSLLAFVSTNVRVADDCVVMVAGTREHAEALRTEVAALLASMGLRLSNAKTRVVHMTKGSTSWGSASNGDDGRAERASGPFTPTHPRRRSPR